MNMTIEHIYPVRGHSYSQCDRNFGLIRASLKKKENITTAKPYLEAISTCRAKPFPFEVSFDASAIKQWSTLLDQGFLKKGNNHMLRDKSSGFSNTFV